MTQKNKLIVGAVFVLGAYYLYTKNKTKSEVADFKDGADAPATTSVPSTIKPIIKDFSSYIPLQLEGRPFRPQVVAPELRADSIQVAEGGNKFSNFAGKRGNSYFETIF